MFNFQARYKADLDSEFFFPSQAKKNSVYPIIYSKLQEEQIDSWLFQGY